MHIPENYLSPATCTVMFAAMVPVWKKSIDKVKIQIQEKPSTVPMIGIGAAFSFLIMMFNFPLPGGTTAHAIGGVLLACLIGPYAACLSVSLALLFQAFLFGDGGILALGANTFNMAFLMPFIGYGIYKLLAKKNHDSLGVIIGAYIGILFAAFGASLELGIQPLISHTANGMPNYFPYQLNITVPVMVGSHLIVGIVEALFTYIVYSFVRKADKSSLYFFQTKNISKKSSYSKIIRTLLVILTILAVLTPIGLLAQGTAWAEWSNSDLANMLKSQGFSGLPHGIAHGFNYSALFSDYQIQTLPDWLAYILISLTVLACVLILAKVFKNEGKK